MKKICSLDPFMKYFHAMFIEINTFRNSKLVVIYFEEDINTKLKMKKL